jgi:hypothetical protein
MVLNVLWRRVIRRIRLLDVVIAPSRVRRVGEIC